MTSSLVILAESPDWRWQALGLAERLGLTFLEHPPAEGLVLVVGEAGLGLYDPKHPREQPLRVDFTRGSLGYRLRDGFRKDELLPRAVGLKGKTSLSILDATAGLGRDAWTLASLGCHLTLCERHPVVHALLEDGLARAWQVPELASIVSRMRLLATDALAFLAQNLGTSPEVILLDPMFPERHKSALVKKPMRLFHSLVGADEDAVKLLKLALEHAARRVVVKRPLHAPYLGDLTPAHSHLGKTVRFDVYLTG